LPAEFLVLAALVVLNLRGVKESVNVLAPIFVVFVVAHVVTITEVKAAGCSDGAARS
jgi:amino acid transporter